MTQSTLIWMSEICGNIPGGDLWLSDVKFLSHQEKRGQGKISAAAAGAYRSSFSLQWAPAWPAGNEDAPTHAQDISAPWIAAKFKKLIRSRGGRDWDWGSALGMSCGNGFHHTTNSWRNTSWTCWKLKIQPGTTGLCQCHPPAPDVRTWSPLSCAFPICIFINVRDGSAQPLPDGMAGFQLAPLPALLPQE